jgi:UDP-N-acetylmuramoylalanine--D-glutamate ligase
VAAKTVILGGGESGVGAAVLAQRQGFEVFLSDAGKIKDKYRKVLLQHEIAFEEKKHTPSLILDADEIVKSPGIPDDVSIVEEARKNTVPVISEIDFSGRFTD